MVKGNAPRTKGQVKPGKERGAPGAVRAGEDAERHRRMRDIRDTGVEITGVTGYGRVVDGFHYGDTIYGKKEGARIFTKDGGRTWEPEPGYGESAPRYTPGGESVGMEAGANSGRPIGEGTEAKGGERAAGVSNRLTSEDFSRVWAKSDDPIRNLLGGVYWTESERTIVLGPGPEAGVYTLRTNEQEQQAENRSNRQAAFWACVGLTLGLLLPLAYQMVSRG